MYQPLELTLLRPAAAHDLGQLRGAGEAVHGLRQVGVGVAVVGHEPAQHRHHPVGPDVRERRRPAPAARSAPGRRPGRRGGPPGPSRRSRGRSRAGCACQSRPWRRRTRRRRTADRARRPASTRRCSTWSGPRPASASAKSRPTTRPPGPRPSSVERQVAGAAAHVERRVAGCSRAARTAVTLRQRPSMPPLISRFIRSYAGRDPVEHLPYLFGFTVTLTSPHAR